MPETCPTTPRKEIDMTTEPAPKPRKTKVSVTLDAESVATLQRLDDRDEFGNVSHCLR